MLLLIGVRTFGLGHHVHAFCKRHGFAGAYVCMLAAGITDGLLLTATVYGLEHLALYLWT